jgi:hypothetical protein
MRPRLIVAMPRGAAQVSLTVPAMYGLAHTEPSNVRRNADGLMLQEGTLIPDSTDRSISPSPGGIRVYRAGFHSGRDSADHTGCFPDDLGFWRDFHDQAVAPAVLRVGQRLDGPGELRLTLLVHEPGGSLEPPLANTGAHARLRLDVADPVGALAMLRDQVVVALALREPDLDFTRQAAAPAGGGEIQKGKRRRVEHGGKVYTTVRSQSPEDPRPSNETLRGQYALRVRATALPTKASAPSVGGGDSVLRPIAGFANRGARTRVQP